MPDSTISIKDQAAYLRTNNFWIGKTCSETFVRNLYDLASRNVITSEQWNTYGNAARSWDKQSRAILTISKIADPAKAADTEEKTAVLKINGYWIDGKSVGAGVIDNLYALYANEKITSDEWNKLGSATLPWDKQSAAITSRLDRPTETTEETAPAAVEEETPPQPAEAVEDEPAADAATVEGTVPNTGTGTGTIASYEYLLPPSNDKKEPLAAETEETADKPALEGETLTKEPIVPDYQGFENRFRNNDGSLNMEAMVSQLVEDQVSRLALRELFDIGIPQQEMWEQVLSDVEAGMDAESILERLNPDTKTSETAEEIAPSSSAQEPAALSPAPAAEATPEEALETAPVVEDLSAEGKQKQISELLELRGKVKNASWYEESENPTYLPKKPRTDLECRQLKKARIDEIDEQIRALDPQAVPSDRVLWKPWTWDMFNN